MEQDMQYIWQVYQSGSFSAAAERLYMTQPALSIAVRRVEDQVGAELFDRSRRPLMLTEAGKAYMEAIRRIRSTEQDLTREIEDLRGLKTGLLRLGGTQYLNSYLLADVLSCFTKAYPGIRVDLREDSAAGLAEALKKQELDLIFSCDPLLLEEYKHKPAFYDHVLLAVPDNAGLPEGLENAALSAEDILKGRHLEEDCPRASLSHFAKQDFILLGPGNNLHQRSISMLEEAGVQPKVKMMLAQLVTAYVMADNGLGAAFVCDRIVRSAASHLRFFRIDSAHAIRAFYVLLPERSYTPFAVRTFMDYAVHRIRESDLAHGRDWGIPE